MEFDLNSFIQKMGGIITPEDMELLKKEFSDYIARYSKNGILYPPLDVEIHHGIRKILKKMDSIPRNQLQTIQELCILGIQYQEFDKLRGTILKTLGNIRENESDKIIQTVVGYTSSYQQMMMAKDAEYKFKIWVTFRDDLVREEHVQMDLVRIRIDEKFVLPNGDALDYPCDSTGRLESILGCRCFLLFSNE